MELAKVWVLVMKIVALIQTINFGDGVEPYCLKIMGKVFFKP